MKRKNIKAKPKTAEELAGFIRLNKFIADSGFCSRRKADEHILAGDVQINGTVCTELGTKVTRADNITVKGKELKAEKNVYVLLNKPRGYITTTKDPQNRRTVMELVKHACPERIYPVGRLDKETSGLLLLTNDGDLAQQLMHPSYDVQKMYSVTLDKDLSASDFAELKKGVTLEDGFLKVDEIDYVAGLTKKDVGVALHSGKNRVVRRLFEFLGYEVVKLDRVMYAGMTKKNLQRGHFRLLNEKEIIRLKHFKV